MRTFMILLTLGFGSTVMAREATEWDRKLVKVANKEGVPALLLAAICFVESSHRDHVTNPDDGGSSSIGLCQIKLATAQMMGYTGTVEGLYDGMTNAKWAAKYIKWQLKRYGGRWDDAAAAYNAGSVFMSKDDPTQYKNQGYVDKVNKATLK